jgi:histidinol-phosphate aminotransferase
LNYQGVDLNDDFEIDLNAMLHSIETHQPKLIFIAYPNNPTGNTFDDLRQYIDVVRQS